MSMPFKGFDTGVYTLHVGPGHKKLTVLGYVLTKIPPINKLIVDKNLIGDEPVSLEAYDPHAFANVLALVRDGYDGYEALKPSQQLIKAYIVAYDLNLEGIQNFLINQVKTFHWTHPVQPSDFELLYAAELTSDCKIHTFLLHTTAHDFQVGLYRDYGSEGGMNLNPEHVKQMECLSKVGLIQLSHQITLLSTNLQCAPCHSTCYFHDHVFTPRCTTLNLNGQYLSTAPVAIAAQLEGNAKNHIFRFTIRNPNPATDKKVNRALHPTCVTEESNTVSSDLLNPDVEYTGSTSYTKIAQWLETTAGSKKDEPESHVLAAEKSLLANMAPMEETSRNQSGITTESTEEPSPNVLTPPTNSRSDEADMRNDLLFGPLQPSPYQELQADELTSSEEASEPSKAVMPKSTPQKVSRDEPSTCCVSHYSSGEDDQEEDLDDVAKDIEKLGIHEERQKNTEDTVKLRQVGASDISDTLQRSPKVRKDVEDLVAKRRISRRGLFRALERSLAYLEAATESTQLQHQVLLDSIRPFLDALNQSPQVFETDSGGATAAQVLENVASRLDANSRGSPLSQPIAFTPFGVDAVRDSKSTTEPAKESKRGNKNQNTEEEIGQEPQDHAAMDSDKEVLDEIAEDIKSLEEDLESDRTFANLLAQYHDSGV